MHDYRWRLGLADGERRYDDLEKRLAALPVVTVPAITMEGDSNGAIHAPSTAYRNKLSGKYDYRLITGGVGHNSPQEAPRPLRRPWLTSTVSDRSSHACPADDVHSPGQHIVDPQGFEISQWLRR
jgi:hypothetical protein